MLQKVITNTWLGFRMYEELTQLCKRPDCVGDFLRVTVPSSEGQSLSQFAEEIAAALIFDGGVGPDCVCQVLPAEGHSCGTGEPLNQFQGHSMEEVLQK